MGINAKTIHEGHRAVLGPNSLSYHTVAKWTSCFREGRDINANPRSASPLSKFKGENIELV